MQVPEINPAMLKLVLRTSEGFQSQLATSTNVGHAKGAHLRGAAIQTDDGVVSLRDKTRFCSGDDQVEALGLLLKTREGTEALSSLAPGLRKTVKGRIGRLFPVAVITRDGGATTFSVDELAAAGFASLECVAVLEGRERAGRAYFNVFTFYPKIEAGSLFARRK